MRHDQIQAWLDACTAAATPAELERVLAEARANLTESEYTAFLGKAISTTNIAADPGRCPNCGNDKDGLDLYAGRGGEDTIICRQCGAQFAGIDYPALLDYLYGKRNRQAD